MTQVCTIGFPRKTWQEFIPRTLAELVAVKGVGPKTLAQYGQAVLEIVTGCGQ